MTGKVTLPGEMVVPGLPEWAVYGDAVHRHNLISSIYLDEHDLEDHNRKLTEKYRRIAAGEQRANLHRAEGARLLVVACNTPARMAKGAVESQRAAGLSVGLWSPVTLWPFPVSTLKPLLSTATDLLVVEGSNGQLEDELRLALSHAEAPFVRIHSLRHMGGVLPEEREIAEKIRSILTGKHTLVAEEASR
jgi:pyruvate/2-oxoacid:ferredoxin oxidoreductase alpha subunit